jgi:ATP-binding cassette, subfamily B, bacterial
LLSKINNVTSAIDQLIPELLWTHLNALMSFIVTFVFLVMIDPKAATIFLLLLVVLIGFNRMLAEKKTRLAKEAAESSTNLRARIVDVISNVQAVRQYVKRVEEESIIQELSSEIRRTHKESWMYSEKMLFWNTCILFVFSLGMFWLLIMGWQNGTVTTGEVVLILALYSQITGTLIFIGRAFNSTARTIGEMEEGLGELLVPYEIVDVPEAQELIVPEAVIDWKSVSFAFDKKSVFENFSLTIPSGQKVGLVGQSGAGKTTFVSLLLRQHELNSGSILIDNQDIARVTQDSLRKAIAVVPQEPVLFHRTIRENIMYGNSGTTEESMIDVAKKAQAHNFIMELPDGYETMVGERGIKLSGGQKQRIAIARAMLKNAPILLLDEATSALDSESEVAIQKALEILMQGRTVIAIAHRLSTLRKMDRIIVLEKGQIREDGSHEKLVAKNGLYAKLWDHQAGGFLQDE